MKGEFIVFMNVELEIQIKMTLINKCQTKQINKQVDKYVLEKI